MQGAPHAAWAAACAGLAQLLPRRQALVLNSAVLMQAIVGAGAWVAGRPWDAPARWAAAWRPRSSVSSSTKMHMTVATTPRLAAHRQGSRYGLHTHAAWLRTPGQLVPGWRGVSSGSAMQALGWHTGLAVPAMQPQLAQHQAHLRRKRAPGAHRGKPSP